MKPVLVIPSTDYVVCFGAEEETASMRWHFMHECGWTAKEYNRIKAFAWFSANVSLWREGKMLGEEFLGACCYENEDDFWTTHACDYFSDMVCGLVSDHAPHLLPWCDEWRAQLRKGAIDEAA